MRRRATSLGSVLVFLSVIGILTLTMAAVSLHHVQFSNHDANRNLARSLAESALAEALDTVVNSAGQTYGTTRKDSETFRIRSADYPADAYGVVTFSKKVATDEKMPWSTNNIGSGAITPGSLGENIPDEVVHVIAIGHCAGINYALEMQLHVPPFPNALASVGPVRSIGGLLVGGVSDPASFPRSYDLVAPEKKVPAHVASNSSDAKAVDLGAGARVEGNVMAVGGIKLDPSVKVRGEVRPQAGPQPIPKLDLTALFGRLDAQKGVDVLASPSIATDLEVKWTSKRTGSLTIDQDLILDGGVLYVTGDLEVKGTLKGHGSIVVGGVTKIQAGSVLTASDQVALVSKGRITLLGQDKDNYFFQGLVYSEAEVVARNLTVLGAIVARGLGGLELEDMTLINSSVTVNIIDGLEIYNTSDDDSDKLIIRVEARDPATRKPLSYRVQWQACGDQKGKTVLGPPQEATGLKGYDEIKAFISAIPNTAHYDGGTLITRDSWHSDWYWNPGPDQQYGPTPLQSYLDAMEGKGTDPTHRYTINFDPNQALGVVERTRVLIWREIAP